MTDIPTRPQPLPPAAATPSGDQLNLRNPTTADGAAMWRLARDSRVLDLNSSYSYLLLAAHFGATSVVADNGSELVGFVTAYRPPERPGVIFVWQITTASSVRGQGVAGRMLSTLVKLDACKGVDHLETHVTPSNKPSRALFGAFARRLGTQLAEEAYFPAHLFPAEDPHEEEKLLRVGPF
jgi:L-2,4-diaminobutyric acid acetyltransferase